jgi:hypothetical protein
MSHLNERALARMGDVPPHHSYCLNYLPEADFDEIHFFGDK